MGKSSASQLRLLLSGWFLLTCEFVPKLKLKKKPTQISRTPAPWTRVFLDMLIFAQVVDKFPFLARWEGGGRLFIAAFTRVFHWSFIQSQGIHTHTVTLLYSKNQININLPTESRSFQYWLFRRTDLFQNLFFVVFPPLFGIGEIWDSEIMRVNVLM
jgi:hypothetical protein